MDEVDAITPKRETSSRGMEKRIVAQVRAPLAALVVLFIVSFVFVCVVVLHMSSVFADLARQRFGTLNCCLPGRI